MVCYSTGYSRQDRALGLAHTDVGEHLPAAVGGQSESLQGRHGLLQAVLHSRGFLVA